MSESDQSCAIPEKTQRALKINPGQLHFEKGHPFPRAVLSYVNKHYNHKKDERDQAGPKSSSQTAKQLYGLKELLNMKVVSPEGMFFMEKGIVSICILFCAPCSLVCAHYGF